MNLTDYVMNEALSGGGGGSTMWTARFKWDNSSYYTTMSARAVAYGMGDWEGLFRTQQIPTSDTSSIRMKSFVSNNQASFVVATTCNDSTRAVYVRVTDGEIENVQDGVKIVHCYSDNAVITVYSQAV